MEQDYEYRISPILKKKQRMRNIFSRLRKFHQGNKRRTVENECKREKKQGTVLRVRVLDIYETMHISKEECV